MARNYAQRTMRRKCGWAQPLLLCLALGCTDPRRTELTATARSVRTPAENTSSTPPSPDDSVPRWTFDDPAAIEQRLADDLSYLASDALGGRGPFTDGLEQAATHLAAGFRTAGLDTKIYGDSPFHVFRSTIKQSLASGSELHWTFAGNRSATNHAESPADFIPLSISGSGSFNQRVVFAGYGLTQPELGWDDYEGLDVAGALVVILRHEPTHLPEPASRERTGAPAARTHLTQKVANALRHGAAGILFATDSRHLHPTSTVNNSNLAEDALLAFHVEGAFRSDESPVLHVRRALVDRWLADSGQPNLREIEARIDATQQPHSFAIPDLSVAGRVTIERKRLTLQNVVGSLAGRGSLRDEIVIVGAHYDHLGTGGGASLAPWTVAIHNGADDNGSGSAGLLEVARQVAARQGESSRRILFVAFSAEEMGLIGSERFITASPVPLRDVVAMVNLDMIGRLRTERLIVSGTGTARSFKELVQKHGARQHFRLRLDPSGFGPSDHASFHAQGIPVLHFFTGMHEDYHRPSDDFDKINIDGLRRIVAMVTDTVLELAEADERPRPFPMAARPSDDDRPGNEDSAPGQRPLRPAGPKPRALGISIETKPPGVVRITRVAPRSVAEAAQLRVGDIIREVQGKSLANGKQLIDHIKATDAPRTMTFRIERDGAELELEVEFPS